MRRLKCTLALCAFFVLAGGLAACGGGIPGDSVADMAGNPISLQSFHHWIYVAAKGNAAQAPGQPVILPNDPPDFNSCIAQVRKQIPTLAKTSDKQVRSDCKQLFTSLGSQVMDFLIRASWYQAEAAKRGIKLTDAQVQQAFQRDKTQQFPNAAAFNRFLSQSGQTMEDILFRVRINELLKKLLAKHTTPVNATTIQNYYNSHRSQFGSPQSRDLRIIRTDTAKQAAAARAALQSGQSWRQVAKKYSVDSATKNKGGLSVAVTRGQEEQALDKAAFSAPKNRVVGPIKGAFGYYVFQVVTITSAAQQSLTAATPLIHQILTSQSQQNAQTALDKEVKKNWLSKTKCRSDYAMADCSGYKPPKSSSSSSSQSAPGQQSAPPAQSAPSQQSAPPTTTRTK